MSTVLGKYGFFEVGAKKSIKRPFADSVLIQKNKIAVISSSLSGNKKLKPRAQ